MREREWRRRLSYRRNNLIPKRGFAKVKAFEAISNPLKGPDLQLAHLLDIANHEQGVILQPLIYDGPGSEHAKERDRAVISQKQLV